MDKDSSVSLLLILGVTAVIVTEVRIIIHNVVTSLSTRVFLLEMLATFQFCTGFIVLHPLTMIEPKPQVYLAHIYSFSTLHFYLTLAENTSNQASTLVSIMHKDIPMRLGLVQILAQFLGAFLARMYQNALYAMKISNLLTSPLVCSHPLQTDLPKAFCTELISSITFQFSMLESQWQETHVRAGILSFAITSLIYAGGHLTGAIFNPALALSMHLSCFFDKVWDYILVYWIAPSLGSVLVVLMWDEIIPMLQRAR